VSESPRHGEEMLAAAEAMRRAMLGDEYVDGQTDEPNPRLRDFQEHIMAMAWGVWAREGPLSTRDRSLVVLAITAALGRMEEFEIHAGARHQTGVTDDELDELLFQIAAYAGGPAGLSAKRAVKKVRAAETES
jgi:4-carboxymuconolactone decarboxylase